jgi:uncharacterized protein YggE
MDIRKLLRSRLQAARLPRRVGAVAAITCAAASIAAGGQPPERTPVIVTTGTAVVQRTPDVAFVTVGIESRARTPREAQQQNAAAATAVVRRLTDLSIRPEARRTLGLRLDEEFDNVNGRRVSKGFVAHSALEVRVDDIARTGEIADAAVQAGATSLDGVRFDLKDRPAAERDALRLAVADARARADAAAAGAGLAIDRVLRIEEGEHMQPQPLRPMIAMRSEATTPVESGVLEIRVSVTMTVAVR